MSVKIRYHLPRLTLTNSLSADPVYYLSGGLAEKGACLHGLVFDARWARMSSWEIRLADGSLVSTVNPSAPGAQRRNRPSAGACRFSMQAAVFSPFGGRPGRDVAIVQHPLSLKARACP